MDNTYELNFKRSINPESGINLEEDIKEIIIKHPTDNSLISLCFNINKYIILNKGNGDGNIKQKQKLGDIELLTYLQSQDLGIGLLEDRNKYFFLINNKILLATTKLNKLFANDDKIVIEVVPRIRGGGFFDMFKSIIQIGKFFIMLIDIIIWFVKFIAWFVFFLGWLFKFLVYDLLTDFYHSIILIVVSICKFPIDVFTAFSAFVLNAVGGWMSSIWGWDQSSLSPADRASNYFRSYDRTKGKKCYLTNSNKVPFSILLGTIICPPMGVFMDLGISGWFNIFICMILTLLYYIPGLIYALLVIYS